jgi:hypothetical protein
MPEDPSKKLVAISVTRTRPFPPKVVVASGFKLRHDKVNGLMDLLFELSDRSSERLTLDSVIIRTNLDMFKRYIAGMREDQDDAAEKDDIPSASSPSFANILHVSHIGPRAETIFGLISYADWADAARKTQSSAEAKIISTDSLVVFSSSAFQKKLLLELTLSLVQQPQL